MTFQHGGQLERIKKENPDQLLPWVDLSTGISPLSYPVESGVMDSFTELPQCSEALKKAAMEYYGSRGLLLTPGSMWSIQNLPLLRRLLCSNDQRPVLIPKQGFNEHKKAWLSWGYQIEQYDDIPNSHQLRASQVCVVINPNNPTGKLLEPETLLSMHRELSKHNAWLLVDEAFMDMTPENSLVANAPIEHLIILKSFGKFFGLPGLRLGALIGPEDVLKSASKLLNDWSINSAAQKIAMSAWQDQTFHYQAKFYINGGYERLSSMLNKLGYQTQGTKLFQTYYCADAQFLYRHLLEYGIYVRLLDDKSGIRFALPKEQTHWERLEQVLSLYERAGIKNNPL